MDTPREPLNQGEFGTCTAHALMKVVTDLLLFKYNVAIDMKEHVQQVVEKPTHGMEFALQMPWQN